MYITMKSEINCAVDLLCSYIQRFGTIKQLVEQFRTELAQCLFEHYQGHWYPDKPIKGQGYRSLTFSKENLYSDRIVDQVCHRFGFSPSLLGIQHELTLWIDPYEVSVRLGKDIYPRENQQIIIARFNKEGHQIIKYDIDRLLSENLVPAIDSSEPSSSSLSPTDCVHNSGTSVPQRLSSPLMPVQQSMFGNGPLFTPPRSLSPQASEFYASLSTPIDIPSLPHPLECSINIDDSLLMDDNTYQPERSDTPHSMSSTTSNESSDSGFCGFVESFPYYYKLNRLNKALAIQKNALYMPSQRKTPHANRRVSRHMYVQRTPSMVPNNMAASPPTPTPMNIDQLAPFYNELPSIDSIPYGITSNRKSKY